MQEQISDEDLELFTDQKWRLNNLYTIQDEQGNRIPFRMNETQNHFYDNQHGKDIILKARQMGFTTLIQLIELDECIFLDDRNAGVIAHNREDAEDFFTKKIKFAYENMDAPLKSGIAAKQDSAKQLSFDNGSSIRVGTSLRSGTYQLLHISELGKISAKYPEKAKEIKSGALNTVHEGSKVWIESTAEGTEGEFFDMCQKARKLNDSGAELTRMDFKFHFYPWYKEPRYVLAGDISIPSTMQEYFTALEDEQGIQLTQEQKNWYFKKSEEQGDDMKREFPSTPDEAFEASIEGAYFAKQMQTVRKNGQICSVPYEASLPVNTFWDLGMGDNMTIWFHQRVGLENRFIDYYEFSGEGFGYYKKMLDDKGYVYGTHYGPHDLEVRNLGKEATTRKQIAADLGIKFEVVKRVSVKLAAIDAARGKLPSCWFDEVKCAQGVRHLDNYRKEFDDKHGIFRDKPRHDEASHGADSFMTFATGFEIEEVYTPPQQENYAVGGWMGS
ncbi:MAG: terminase [Proteobacteria bacterium]|nr:terminase [Pseudomonadota bacterium]